MALEIRITPGSPTPLYRQIVDQVRRSVATGALQPGDALPSVRALAEQLVINPNTVARAYSDLTHDGVLHSHPGRGLFVAERRQIYSDEERQRRLSQAVEAFLHEVALLGFSHDEIFGAVTQGLSELEPGLDRQRDGGKG